ncbi:hypothetical protein [Streptomyces anandii]|uniref:hypothetical protein n=1 Tax=Streptomyces anandii TaxID=285454 RepID=UPI0036ADE846
MATPVENPDGGVQGGNPDEGNNAPGPNPAWEPVLSLLPEQFHSVVTPHFQEWDKSAQSRIESVNQQLSQFEPYKAFAEHGITSDEIEQGLRLMYEINNNPQNVYNALQEAYKFGAPATPVANPGNDDGEEGENPLANIPPEILSQLGEQGDLLKTVAQMVLNDATAKRDAAADKELDDELNGLREKIGDYDERYVLSLMQNGMSAEEAGQAFVELKQSLAPKPFAPSVLGAANGGAGAGVPSNQIDVTKLSSKDTRGLVAQMLAQAAQQR